MSIGMDGFDAYEKKSNCLTEKQKYIAAFLDGYFYDKKLDYNLLYFKIIEKGEKMAEKKWKEYKKQKL
jgi:hypothetical protein